MDGRRQSARVKVLASAKIAASSAVFFSAPAKTMSHRRRRSPGSRALHNQRRRCRHFCNGGGIGGGRKRMQPQIHRQRIAIGQRRQMTAHIFHLLKNCRRFFPFQPNNRRAVFQSRRRGIFAAALFFRRGKQIRKRRRFRKRPPPRPAFFVNGIRRDNLQNAVKLGIVAGGERARTSRPAGSALRRLHWRVATLAMRYSRTPPGVLTSMPSPSVLPRSARPSGDDDDSSPFSMSASYSPTRR